MSPNKKPKLSSDKEFTELGLIDHDLSNSILPEFNVYSSSGDEDESN